MAVFSRNTTSGRLSLVETETGGSPAIPQGVVVSPDDKNVYVSEYGFTGLNGGVITYSRNTATGALTFVEKDEGRGLDGAQFLDISPNGKSVYVPALGDSALNVFSRNAATGALTLVETKRNGGGVDGLHGAIAAAVSMDGKDVDRNGALPGNGRDLREECDHRSASVPWSEETGGGACDLSVSPDDANVYVAGCDSQDIATFSRNVSTGALGFVGLIGFGDPGVEMRQAWGPSISPDGQNVYTADITGDAVDTFITHAPPFRLTLKAKARQSADDLKVTAECSLGCNLSGSAHVKVGKAKYDSHAVKETLSGLAPTELKLAFPSATLKAIRSQLKRHSGTATIRMNTLAASGKKTEEITVRLKR